MRRGQVTAAGEEPLVIQTLTADSFDGADVVFFAADAATTREYWRRATAAGAGVVDLTGVLRGEAGVSTRAPLLVQAGLQEQRLDLTVEAVSAAHPATLMLAYVSLRLQEAWAGRASLSATVLLPASEQGKEGMDELHAQTVALLSFQSLPQDVYDTQVTFNLNAGLGSAARVGLDATTARIAGEVKALLTQDAAASTSFQCLQAPVFHGCAISAFVKLDDGVTVAAVEDALAHPTLLTMADEEDALPNNATANEQETMQAKVQADAMTEGRGFWIWIVADNLRLQARNAVACAGELMTMRPGGRVQ